MLFVEQSQDNNRNKLRVPLKADKKRLNDRIKKCICNKKWQIRQSLQFNLLNRDREISQYILYIKLLLTLIK